MRAEYGVHFRHECQSHNVYFKFAHSIKIKKKRKKKGPIATMKILKK